MSLIFPYILFTCAVAALFLSVLYYKKDARKYPENHLFSLLCFFSAIWSLGFWGVNIQTVPDNAYIFRTIGMLGVFSYFIFAQLLVCQLAAVQKSYAYPISAVSMFGYIICYFITRPGQVTYQLTSIGMTYRFHPGFWNNMYVIYCIVVSFNILTSVLYMLFYTPRKRMRVIAKKLLFSEFAIILGMLFDTFLPLLGKPAIPGSPIGQFVGVIAMYQAIRFLNRSRINIDNMSTYVYYSLNTPVLVYDQNYKLQILNDVAFDFIGLKESETETVTISSLFSVNEEEAFQFHGKQKDMDVLCYYNQLNCNLSINKIHDDYYDVIGYIITVTDLSERMEYINKLEQAIGEAKNANQAKTTFLANMSHEIRTPMNAIIGFTELILKQEVSKDVREYVEGIHISSRNLLAIINDILDITKIESGKMEIIPDNYYIADLLDDVSLIISQQARTKGLRFEMNTDENLPTQLYGDKVRIRGILINILNNAVKYTKEGTVSFEITVLSQTKDPIKLAFIVSDTGIGIKPEDRETMFKSFERLDQQIHYGVEGSGLGLAIAKGYVTLMGGEIKVDSVYGKGSVFTIILDQTVVDPAPMHYLFTIDKLAQDTSDNIQLLVHDVQVLLVDDNHINLSVAKALLKSYGLSVDTAASGADAIALCQNIHYPIIFMDQMMPEIDGIEAMLQIRKIDPFYAPGGEGKIIVLTADAIRGSRENLIAKGFDEYLGKPMNLKQLERLLVLFLPEDKITISTKSAQKEAFLVSSSQYNDFNQSDMQYLQEALSDLDIAFGLETSGGTISDYLNVLKINYTYGYKNLDELKDLLQRQDYENYTIKIHAMKSTTKGMGAMKVSDMALAQETAGKAGEYSFIDSHFDEFQTAYHALIQEIEAVLHHYHMLDEEDFDTNDDNKEEITQQMISNLLSMIQKHLDSFAFSEIFEILEDVKKYRIPHEARELFSQLETLMNDLNIEEAKQLVTDYLISNL